MITSPRSRSRASLYDRTSERSEQGFRYVARPSDTSPWRPAYYVSYRRRAAGLVLFVALFASGGLAAADVYGHRGHGDGHGMMGMGGQSMGMMGMGPMHMAGLSDAQREKINRIADENRKKMWQLMGQRMDEQAKLRDLYAAETLDAGKILAVYDRMHRIKREMVEGHIKAHNAMLAVLTPEQREQMKNRRRGMPMGPGGSHGGMPGPGMMGR